MDTLPEFVIAGIPLIVIVFGIVEEIKAWGVTGSILRIVSLVLGVVFAVLFQLAKALPVDLMGWLVVVVVGLAYGLTASGAYNFLNKRFPAKV